MKKTETIYLPFFQWFYNTGHDLDDEYIISDFIQHIQEWNDTYWSGSYEAKISKEDLITLRKNNVDYMDAFDIFDKHYDIDYKKYRKDYSEEYVKTFNSEYWEELSNIWITDLKFESLYSPQYYNYGNDEINATVSYDIEKIEKMIMDNKESFSEYILSENTSRDWFTAFGETELTKYLVELRSEPLKDIFLLTQVIDFYLQEEIWKKDDIIRDLTLITLEDMPIFEYIFQK